VRSEKANASGAWAPSCGSATWASTPLAIGVAAGRAANELSSDERFRCACAADVVGTAVAVAARDGCGPAFSAAGRAAGVVGVAVAVAVGVGAAVAAGAVAPPAPAGPTTLPGVAVGGAVAVAVGSA